MAVKAIPEGYHTVTPYIIGTGVAKLIDFLKRAFDAKEIVRMATPDGTVAHAEIKIGDSVVMMGEGGGENKPMSCALYVYVPDTDAVYAAAMRAGATSVHGPVNKFYGDRNATVSDACGNLWTIATHIEDVSPEEMRKRAEAEMRRKG